MFEFCSKLEDVKTDVMNSNIIETHAHIYSSQFDEDREIVIERAKKSGVGKILMPNVDLDSFEAMMSLTEKHKEYCLPMLGLHPSSVNADYKDQLDQLYAKLSDNDFIAIGETGIDLYWDKTFYKEQIDSFKIQIDWAKQLDLPIVIHSRDANSEITKVLEDVQDGTLRGEVHCFSGSVQEGQKFIDLGMYLGIGGVVTFKNGGLDKIVTDFPLGKLLLETDAPYLTPAPFRGKRNEPAYLEYVVDRLAQIFNCSSEEVIEETKNNALELFRIVL